MNESRVPDSHRTEERLCAGPAAALAFSIFIARHR